MPRKKTIVEPIEKIWLSTKEAATYLGMSTGFIHDLRKGGSLPHCMIGNTAFFLKRDIDALLEHNRVF
jgi:excisionase family DNA binding protein